MRTVIEDGRVDIWQWPGVPGFWLSVVRAVVLNGKRDYVRWEYEIGSFEDPSGYDSIPRWFKGTGEAAKRPVRSLFQGAEEFDTSATALYVTLAIARDASTEIWRQGHAAKAKCIEAEKDIPGHIETRIECAHWLASLRKHLLGDDIPAPTGPIEEEEAST